MMKTQYYSTTVGGNRSYSLPSELLVKNAQSRLSLFDNAILYRTGQDSYSLYVDKPVGQDYEVVYTYSDGYYTYSIYNWTAEKPSISAPMYCYSTLGYGYPLESGFNSSFLCYALGGIVTVLFLALLFKGVLFKWLKR